VIHICKDEQIGEVHFDTSHINHVKWKETEGGKIDLTVKLKDRICATLGDGPGKREAESE